MKTNANVLCLTGFMLWSEISNHLFWDCRLYVPILANTCVAKLTFFGIFYICRCPIRVAGLGRQRLSNKIHHGRRFCSSGNGAWSIRFIPPCTDSLRGCWGTPQVRGSIGGRFRSTVSTWLGGLTHAIDGVAIVHGDGLRDRREQWQRRRRG